MTARKPASTSDAATKALAGHNGFSLITDKQLLGFYRSLLECSLLESAESPRKSKPWTWASAVACAAEIKRADVLLAPAGSPIYAHLKGISLVDQMTTGTNLVYSRARSSAGLVKAAIDTALDLKSSKKTRIVLAFAPAHVDDPGVAEALRSAIDQKLPILFVFAPAPRAVGVRSVAAKPKLPEFPLIPIDGEDVVAAYRVASESIARIRRGNGLTLIECLHLNEPTTAPQGPIEKMETYLTRKHLFSESLRAKTVATFSAKLERVRIANS